jgi:hypothetical protein
MKYIFTFSEVNYGRIIIESDHRPDKDEIIVHILEGEADYHNTDFVDFRLIETERSTPNMERGMER